MDADLFFIQENLHGLKENHRKQLSSEVTLLLICVPTGCGA